MYSDVCFYSIDMIDVFTNQFNSKLQIRDMFACFDSINLVTETINYLLD